MKDSSLVSHASSIVFIASCVENMRPYLKATFPFSQAISCTCLHGYDEIISDMYRSVIQERNASQYAAPTEEVVLTENCTAEPAATSCLTEEVVITENCTTEAATEFLDNANSQLYTDDHHKEKSEADLRLVRLFSHIPTFPFPFPGTCERKRGLSTNRSYGKDEESSSVGRAETRSSGVVLSESSNNVSSSKSLNRKRNSTKRRKAGRNSVKKMGVSEEVDF